MSGPALTKPRASPLGPAGPRCVWALAPTAVSYTLLADPAALSEKARDGEWNRWNLPDHLRPKTCNWSPTSAKSTGVGLQEATRGSWHRY